jgi:hypothetical protein
MCTRQEVQDIVDKGFDQYTKHRNEYWKEILDSIKIDNERQHDKLRDDFYISIQKHLTHSKPSFETEKRLTNLEDCNEKQHVILEDLQRMTQEIYSVYTSANWAKKAVIGFFAGVGIITGAIIGIIELVRRSR